MQDNCEDDLNKKSQTMEKQIFHLKNKIGNLNERLIFGFFYSKIYYWAGCLVASFINNKRKPQRKGTSKGGKSYSSVASIALAI